MPTLAKVGRLRAADGAEVIFAGTQERAATAPEALAVERGAALSLPTTRRKSSPARTALGLEILEAVPEVQRPIGGGGLISGVALAI